MTTLKQITDKQEWDDYILENSGHPLQLWGWGEVKSGHGWKAHRLFCINNNEKVVGAVQILVRRLPLPMRSLAYIPRGPVAEEINRDELLSLLAKYVKKTYHSVALTIEPDFEKYSVPKGWRKSSNHILPARTILLDLSKPETELLKVMEPNTRRYIRRSASESILIKKVNNRDELNDCLAVYRETSKRAKFELHGNQYYYDVFDKLGDYSVLFVAYTNNQPIAFLWLAISSETAFELYGGMTELGRKLHASYALKWHAIRKCREWGLSRYDFGGLIDGGVTAFKKGWAKNETIFAGTFDKPLSSSYVIWNRGLPTAKKIVRSSKKIFKRKSK